MMYDDVSQLGRCEVHDVMRDAPHSDLRDSIISLSLVNTRSHRSNTLEHVLLLILTVGLTYLLLSSQLSMPSLFGQWLCKRATGCREL
jgi:hypothetical protein